MMIHDGAFSILSFSILILLELVHRKMIALIGQR